ncbi:methionyl-tRNA formyltransferase [Novosphingobium hassiacum]|uniref:Methionyl-tRNA formyltransferase n=1 Tax=Novosphingobium hassiacum TaxID=173676 RepID=A0A7W5ZZW4_9SPHN|nr:formyltransferase family protein [Novosphingobium hassiacum]MBB3862556.1 methionyl-tRNA formyltransferase [Novosphingobium hassiacum]
MTECASKTSASPPRAILVGAVESTRVALEALLRSGWTVALVVTLPPEASARHSDYVDVSQIAAAAGVPIHQTRQVNSSVSLDAIRTARPDIIFVIGWSQICGTDFCAIAPGRVVGYHPAAIPRLRGRAVIPWTILLDEKITAGTLFWIDEGVDSGALLAQHFFHVAPDETASTLYARHMAVLRAMMDEALTAIAAGAHSFREQDERCATYAARRTMADGAIDWKLSAAAIDRLVRATTRPYPGAFTSLAGRRLTVWGSSLLAVPRCYHALPGQVVVFDGEACTVQTGEGLLRIDEYELEGDGGIPLHAILGTGASASA